MPYLTIPEIVESATLHSVQVGGDGKSFPVTMDVSDTGVRLMRAAQTGEHLPLVVLTLDSQIIALDSVYVAEASEGGYPPLVQLTFVADAVRFV